MLSVGYKQLRAVFLGNADQTGVEANIIADLVMLQGQHNRLDSHPDLRGCVSSRRIGFLS